MQPHARPRRPVGHRPRARDPPLTVSYGARPRCCGTSTPPSRRARCRRSSARTARASRRCCSAALGLVPADAGQALVEGRPGRAALDRVAYVPQRDAVDWDFPITVREVVEMGRYRATGWFRRVARADRAIVARVPGARRHGRVRRPADRRSSPAASASGCSWPARCAQQAPVLVMDEPFAGVDARTRGRRCSALLGELARRGPARSSSSTTTSRTVRAAFDWALAAQRPRAGRGPHRRGARRRESAAPRLRRPRRGRGRGAEDLWTLIDLVPLAYTDAVVVVGAARPGHRRGRARRVRGAAAAQPRRRRARARRRCPGVCVAFLVTGREGPCPACSSAPAIAGLIGALLMVGIERTSRIRPDAAIGVVLSSFFSLGHRAAHPHRDGSDDADQAGLENYLFGQAAGAAGARRRRHGRARRRRARGRRGRASAR